MRRVALFTLLVAALLLAANMQAQRGGGGGMRGGGGRTVTARGGGGRSGTRNGLPGSSRARGFHSNNFGNNYAGDNSLLYPLWDDGPYDEEEAGPPEEYGPPTLPPPMMMAQGSNTRPRRVPAGPKITELPVTAGSAASAPLPPAMFILTNGERIESQQYLVTYDQVQLTVDHLPRTIPLSMLDLNATLAADRQRGIDLRIPAGKNEISLGF